MQNNSIDPSELLQGQAANGEFSFNYSNQPYSFNDAGFGDDELAEFVTLDNNANGQAQFDSQNLGDNQFGSFVPEPNGFAQPASINNIYSHTPDGNPLASPYISGFQNAEQFRQMQQQALNRGTGSPNSFQNNSLRQTSIGRQTVERKGSSGNAKAPMTPKTPAISSLNLGTPESMTIGSQPIINHHLGQHKYNRSLPNNQWESHPGSLQSYAESPLSSPGHSAGHAGINDMISAKHASLPTKVDALPNYQQQEAKRRRRRESHNLVERRRRDNINERIQELSHLVPHHRLEDEKVRKHLMNNSPLSPTAVTNGISPPHATSLLAGGSGRRAAGGITTGIPPDDKDKGPNKGDILNGAVGWMRDLMWCLYVKMMQEEELIQTIQSMGGTYQSEPTEEEKRMRTELMEAVEKNGFANFAYSRAPGTGLRVPKHTDLAGNTLDGRHLSVNASNLHSAEGSPSGTNQGNGPYWSPNGSSGQEITFKEEDEYGMDTS